MGITTIKKEQQNKPFQKWDLLIYLILLVVIITLFGVFVFGKKPHQSGGIEIVLAEKVVASYDFDLDKWQYDQTATNIVVTNDDDNYFVTIYTDQSKVRFNKIIINTKEREVHMLDANCSHSKDCTKMKIDQKNDAIICVPHQLKIKKISAEISPPTSG